MGRKTIGLLTAALLTLAACGGGETGAELPPDPDAPLLQVHSEGGFVPVDINLGRGPIYTLLADGRLIFEGPVIMIYPGPLLPNYQMTRVTDEQMDELMALIEAIGLPEMESEQDDSAAATVADATTEVVTYWDENGAHEYAVYALGVDPNPANPANAAMVELINSLSEAAFSFESEEHLGDRVRVISGVAQTSPDPDFEDVRPWPLEGEDPTQWTELNLGYTCKVFSPEVIASFRDATQVTQWLHPVETLDAPPFVLLVRPLHPGEADCP